jgi:hypothetical protein
MIALAEGASDATVCKHHAPGRESRSHARTEKLSGAPEGLSR